MRIGIIPVLTMIAITPFLNSCTSTRMDVGNVPPIRIYVPALICTQGWRCPFEMPKAIGEGEAMYSMKGLPADCTFDPETQWLVIGPSAPIGTYRVFLVVEDSLNPNVYDEKPYDIIVKLPN